MSVIDKAITKDKVDRARRQLRKALTDPALRKKALTSLQAALERGDAQLTKDYLDRILGKPREEPDLTPEGWAKRLADSPELRAAVVRVLTDDEMMAELVRRENAQQGPSLPAGATRSLPGGM